MSRKTYVSHFHGLGQVDARHCEANRLATFCDWNPNYHAYRTELAKAGFFYTHFADEVECYWCELKRSGWTKFEKPLVVHRDINPTCAFFASDHNGSTVNKPDNIPIPVVKSWSVNNYHQVIRRFPQRLPTARGVQETDQTDEADVEVNPRPQFFGVNWRPSRRPRTDIVRLAGGYSEIATGEEPLYPDYRSEAKRLRSFNWFPQEKAVLAGPLYQSGFFHVGYSDAVVCYQCGVSLQDWRVGLDFPPLAHARWSPTCRLIDPRVRHFVQHEMQIIGQ